MSENQTIKENIIDFLKAGYPDKKDFSDICYALKNSKQKNRSALYELIQEERVIALPKKSTSRWTWWYYPAPEYNGSVSDRFEELFEELGIPSFIDIVVNRGFKVIFIGKYGDRPGFSIIDYNETPPLIFKDNLYGGKNDELVYYKQRSRYICIKNGNEYWYNLHGMRIK